MIAIAGQTAGPNSLTFFEEPVGNIGLKIFEFVSSRLVLGEARHYS